MCTTKYTNISIPSSCLFLFALCTMQISIMQIRISKTMVYWYECILKVHTSRFQQHIRTPLAMLYLTNSTFQKLCMLKPINQFELLDQKYGIHYFERQWKNQIIFHFKKSCSNSAFYYSKIIVDHTFFDFWFRLYAFAKDTTFCIMF